MGQLWKSGLFSGGFAFGFGIGSAVTIISMVPKSNIGPWAGVGVAVVIAMIGISGAMKASKPPQ